MKKTSLWKDGAEASFYPSLQKDLRVDVAIVGGGITGTAAAHLLARQGKNVALLEAWQVGSGTTGFSTGNLYATVEERLKKLQCKFDETTARAVAFSRSAAIGHMENTIREYAIDCDFHRRPWRLLSETETFDRFLQQEYKACLKAGLDAVVRLV